MFKAAAAVGGLAVQLVYFRGADTFHASPFVSNAAALTKIMAEVFCSSGPTQIRKVLHHAQREASRNRIAALIYVGDTTEEEHSLLRRAAQGLAPFGTKVFLFHENPDENADAVGIFREIARVTGGVYLPFDRSSAASELAELLAAIGAYAAGGTRALENSNTAAARLLLGHLR